MSRRCSNQIAPMIDDAIERLSMGDDITWEMNIAPMPPSGALGIMLAVFLPAAVLGDHHMVMGVIPTLHGLDQDAMDNNVRQLIEQARSMRSQELQVPTAESVQGLIHPTNGHRPQTP